jgi:hypothetical protein
VRPPGRRQGGVYNDRVDPVQPVIIRVVGQPTPELGLGQIIAQALGLTGIILIASLLFGVAVGGFIIWVRMRAVRARQDGEAGDQIRLRLEVPRSSASSSTPPAIHTV